jgi:dihydrofolate synthase/folylpolyglutamate synthase
MVKSALQNQPQPKSSLLATHLEWHGDSFFFHVMLSPLRASEPRVRIDRCVMRQNYQDRLDYLYGRLNYEWSGMPRSSAQLRLGRMRRLLRRMGDPHLAYPIIHVAGTKGKGSTSAMIAAALTAAGVRTGLYCSPHLHRLEERFTIDGSPASAAELVALVDLAREAVEAIEKESDPLGQRGATFFEITTAMGLLHFARSKVGAVVLEVGLGGRLDSTNVVHPALSVITSISFDHTRQLGNTLALIAGEKAGILKRGRPALIGVRGSEACDAIRVAARRRRSPLRELDSDFWYEPIPPEPPLTRPTTGRVAARTWKTDWGTLDLPLLGAHQAHNAAVALAALDLLGEVEPALAVSRDDVIAGFAGLKWPARIEIVGQNPWIVVDGAHNPASAAALADTLRTSFPPTRRTLIFGTTRDKDLLGQLQALLPCFDTIIATRYIENPRSVPPEAIADRILEVFGRPVLTTVDPVHALEMARSLTALNDLICVTGSLFLAAESRAIILPQAAAPVVTCAVT